MKSGKKILIIGGGAAGFFCAATAARFDPDAQVTIVERGSKLLSKVKVSGGGRCNVTHALFDIDEMSRRYPRGQNFVKKTFYRFFTTDTINWFAQRGVPLKKEEDGRMFPVTDSSQTIIDCLLNEVNALGVAILLNAEVKTIEATGEQFTLTFSYGERMEADFVCIACGGYPKAAMFGWLQSLGHHISEPVPSLFTFNLPAHPVTALMGVSVPGVRVKLDGSKLMEEGPVLITHWGLSGPAILRLSAWGAKEMAEMGYEFNVHISWLSQFTDQTLKHAFQNCRTERAGQKVSNHVLPGLPNRLWQFLLQQSGVDDELRWAHLPAKSENQLIRNLLHYIVTVKGKTTFKEEFVTAGGIMLGEVEANTMMSRKVAGLYFAGEVLDVDGITGGFNFQHAWTSGWIAGKSIALNTSTKTVTALTGTR